MTGAVMARGVELMRPVSFLLVRLNAVDMFQSLLSGAIQSRPENLIVNYSNSRKERREIICQTTLSK